jgi:integrase
MSKLNPKPFTDAAVKKLKPHPTKRLVIRDDGSTALFLVIQAKTGHKSWMLRYRHGDGAAAKIHLGPLDQSGHHHDAEPVVGLPLTLVQARQLASQINARRAHGADVVGDHRARKHRQKVAVAEASSNSFAVCVKDFVIEHARPKTRGWVETGSVLGLDAELNIKKNGLAHRWSSRDIRSVSSDDLHAVCEEARRFGIPGIAPRNKSASESRQRKTHCALSALFSFLQRKRRVDANPMEKLHLPSSGEAGDRVLTDVEIAKAWAASVAAEAPFTEVIRLLLLTGCRTDEIRELEWSEVSDDCSVISLPGRRTKNKRPHVLELAPMASAIIASQPRNGKYVFSRTGGIAPIGGLSHAKARIDAVAGIAQPWRIHDLRRTAATGMANLGVQPHHVEAVLNHITGAAKKGIAGIYNRAAYAAEKKAALELWAAHISSIVGGGR